jgi:hypothetical protein
VQQADGQGIFFQEHLVHGPSGKRYRQLSSQTPRKFK